MLKNVDFIMSAHSSVNNNDLKTDNYTYPQFVIDEKTGQIEVNFIDKESGRVVRHIPSAELKAIVKDYCSGQGSNFRQRQE